MSWKALLLLLLLYLWQTQCWAGYASDPVLGINSRVASVHKPLKRRLTTVSFAQVSTRPHHVTSQHSNVENMFC